MKIDLTDHIKSLSERAANTNTATPDSALKFSQAALNLAHAMATINSIRKEA